MSEIIGNVVQWKRMWQLTSGIHYDTPQKTVQDKLLEVAKELQDGLHQYHKSSKTSNEKLEKMLKDTKQEKLLSFTKRLYHYLDMDAMQSWDILCYYLVNEYKGSANSLSIYISTESNMMKLLDDIWNYYTLERMIVLKILKNLIEFHDLPKHPYHAEYKSVLDKISMNNLRTSLIDQLEALIKESPPSKLTLGEFINCETKLVAWSERRAREIVEILQILILIANNKVTPGTDLLRLVEVFRLHSFGRQHEYMMPGGGNQKHEELRRRICYCEIGLLLVTLRSTGMTDERRDDYVVKLEGHFLTMYQHEEHGPILLAWMLLNFGRHLDEQKKYRQFGTKAVQLNVFDFMHRMVSHHMFADYVGNRTALLVRHAVYDHLTQLCALFDGDGSVAGHYKIYELLSEILRTPAFGSRFISDEEEPTRSLYNTAIEKFPVEFEPLSLIAASLAASGEKQSAYIRQQLENLPMYTELYLNRNYDIRPKTSGDNDSFYLNHPYRPYNSVEYTIPPGATCHVIDQKKNQTYIHFETKFNYFNALFYEMNELLEETVRLTEIDQARLGRVETGLKCMVAFVKRLKSQSDISSEMVPPIEIIFDVIIKFRTLQTPPIDLLASCVNICAHLLPFFEQEIVNRILNLSVLPVINNKSLDYKRCAMGVSFDSGLVGNYLINCERNRGRYTFLESYFNFLTAASSVESSSAPQNISTIRLPGLVFLLREIFPNIHTWRFEDERERDRIYIQTLQFFFHTLQIDDQTGSPEHRLIHHTCVYSLLNYENGMILLKFIGIGNAFLTATNETESNWMSISKTGLNLIVQLAMTILMSILRHKNKVFVGGEMVPILPLESAIYAQTKLVDTLQIIPIITSYMSNIFNRSLPVLACRLLRVFAIEFQISLLACLDMEPDQIRMTFLQRLCDELENDDLKIAVLEFVEACIEKQSGVTEAFFKLSTNKRKLLFEKSRHQKNIADGILTYMEDYLEAIQSDPKNIVNTLLSRIMSLFHALWKNNMTHLIKNLTDKKTFWPSLCNPLFAEENTNIRAYSQLFNILGLEIFKTSDEFRLNEDLKGILDKFLNGDHFIRWIDIIFDFPLEKKTANDDVDGGEIPDWLGRLQSFKDLMIIVLRKKKHPITVKGAHTKYLSEVSLSKLIDCCVVAERDFRPFLVISELYLIVLVNSKIIYAESTDELIKILTQISVLLNFISNFYQQIHVRSRESILTIAIRIFDLIPIKNKIVSDQTLHIVESIVEIIAQELFTIERTSNLDVSPSDRENYSLILAINLLKKVIISFELDGISGWEPWLIQNKLFNRVCSCLSAIAQNYDRRSITTELLDLLIILCKSSCSSQLLHIDIGDYLWLKLLPPKELLNKSPTSRWQTQDWWPIYTRGIEIVTILLSRHQHLFVKEALMFVGVHEEYLLDSILLGKQTLEPNAINLIKRAMEFLGELVNFEKLWRVEHAQSLFNLMKSVQVIMDHSVSLLYRPQILKRLLDGPRASATTVGTMNLEHSVTGLPADELVVAMNELIEFIILATRCLLVFSPKLLNLLADPEFLPTQWFPLIEIQFGAPKLNAEPFPPLTFGTVLSAACIFVKALNLQHYTFSGTPLNQLPAKKTTLEEIILPSTTKDSTQHETSIVGGGSPSITASSPRTPYAKSISTISATTSVIPANEFLANLDSRLCFTALEYILTLLASQSLLALKDTNLSSREKQLIRRELFTELSIFHDFVKKKILHESKEILYRKKHGCVQMRLHTDDDDYDDDDDDDYAGGNEPIRNSNRSTPSQASTSSDNRNQSMRVHVVRKLHLQQQQQKSHTPSPIGTISPRKSILNLPGRKSIPFTSTPAVGSPASSGGSLKRVNFGETPEVRKKYFDDSYPSSVNENDGDDDDYDVGDGDDDEIQYFQESGEQTYSGQSFVKLVEEDYFHILSVIFSTLSNFDD